jgi:hypothetical protein
MTKVVYHVVEHDGGWAYRVADVFSETFATADEARLAALQAAREQTRPGDAEWIEYQDEAGAWHVEQEAGNDRPQTEVDS